MRIKFPKGKQKEFIEKVLNKTKLNLYSLSKLNKLNYSTLKKYKREELLLPEKLANYLSKISKIDWMNFDGKLISDSWGCKKGGIKGYKTLLKLHYNKVLRWRKSKKTWLKNQTKKVNIPKMNEELAELVGIILGDGTLTKYFVRISFDRISDSSYIEYVQKLCLKLFKIEPKIINEKGKNTTNLRINSIIIANFLNKKLNIPFGSKIKNKTKIPEAIFKYPKLMRACLRGLMDSDGTFGIGLYFNSNNKCLLKQIVELNKNYCIFTTFTKYYVAVCKRSNILKYFKMIGSSNLKNIIRFKEMFLFSKNRKYIYNEDVIKLFKKYKDVKLPFILNGSVV